MTENETRKRRREEVERLASAITGKSTTVESKEVVVKPIEAEKKAETTPALPLPQMPEVFAKCDVLAYFLKTIQYRHVGDTGVIMALLACIANAGTSDAIGAHVVGSSGKGKTTAVDDTLKVVPKEYTLMTDGASSKSLYYGGPMLKDIKIVVLNEDENNPGLRGTERVLSEQRNATYLTVVDTPDGKKTVKLTIPPFMALIKTSVETSGDNQTDNRYLVLNTDESAEQDEKVLGFTMATESGTYYTHEENKEHSEMLANCKDYMKYILTNQKTVIIPWFEFIQAKGTSNRRSPKKFMRLLKGITRLYQAQRLQNDKAVFSSIADFELAKELWERFSKNEATHLNNVELETIEALPTTEAEAVTRKDLAKKLGVKETALRNRLRKLQERGLVEYRQEYDADKHANIYYHWTSKPPSLTLSLATDCYGFATGSHTPQNHVLSSTKNQSSWGLATFSENAGRVFELGTTSQAVRIVKGEMVRSNPILLPSIDEKEQKKEHSEAIASHSEPNTKRDSEAIASPTNNTDPTEIGHEAYKKVQQVYNYMLAHRGEDIPTNNIKAQFPNRTDDELMADLSYLAGRENIFQPRPDIWRVLE